VTIQTHFALAALLAGLAGCGQKPEPPPPEAVTGTIPVSPRAPQSKGSQPATPTVIQNSGNLDATLAQLTQALRDYVVRARAVPRNFEDFAVKSGVNFPPAPAGKKYQIQGQAVVLVDK